MEIQESNSRASFSIATSSYHHPPLAISNDQEPFVITPDIFQLLQHMNQSYIHPIIVLNLHHRPRKLDGLPLRGAVFLKWTGSSLERLTPLELKDLGFELDKFLEDAIHGNWSYFDAQTFEGVASSHDSVPSFTINAINDDCFEFSAPKIKWTVFGGRIVVGANCKESKPKSGIYFFSLLIPFIFHILPWVGKHASDMTSLLKPTGIPLEIDFSKVYNQTELVKELLKDPSKDPVKAVSYGVGVFFLLGVGITKGLSPFAYWITGAVAIYSVALFFWDLIFSSLSSGYSLCFVSVCAALSIIYYFTVIDKKKGLGTMKIKI